MSSARAGERAYRSQGRRTASADVVSLATRSAARSLRKLRDASEPQGAGARELAALAQLLDQRNTGRPDRAAGARRTPASGSTRSGATHLRDGRNGSRHHARGAHDVLVGAELRAEPVNVHVDRGLVRERGDARVIHCSLTACPSLRSPHRDVGCGLSGSSIALRLVASPRVVYFPGVRASDYRRSQPPCDGQ